jgi:hypothetical protein
MHGCNLINTKSRCSKKESNISKINMIECIKIKGNVHRITFVVDYGREGSVEIKNDESQVLGFVIQLSHGLFQQEVVEIREQVFGSIALSE